MSSVGGSLPRAPRIASPSFDRSIGFDVLAIGVAALAAPVILPSNGGYAMLAGLALAALTAMRRRSIGAYETDDALIVRGFLSTNVIPWNDARSVEDRRDPWLPWLRVAAVRRDSGEPAVAVTALRHAGDPPAPVMTLTRIVRDRREQRSRDLW